MTIKNSEISQSELAPFLPNNKCDFSLSEKLTALYHHQLTPGHGCPTLIKNMAKYQQSITKSIKIDDIFIRIAANVTRKNSINANTFTKKEKPATCPLCQLLPGQKGINLLDNRYMAIYNPGITIPKDLTIPTIQHENQLLSTRFDDMLSLSKILPNYSIFYNGALAGASCPHFHFQAGVKNSLPAEEQIINRLSTSDNSQSILKNDHTSMVRLGHFLRSTYVCSTEKPSMAQQFASNLLGQLRKIDQQFIHNISNIPDFGEFIPVFNNVEQEPRFNLMIRYDSGRFLIAFFPKLYNRPHRYFDRANPLILGFAIKEALGHILVKSRIDLKRLTKTPNLIKQAYSETSISPEMDDILYQRLVNIFS